MTAGMKYGFVLPYGDARTAADLAELAEQHGWDGFFCWEPIWGIDAWVCLTAAAMRTTRIRLGTMLTPLPRRRPWELANQTSTLDNLSGGRVVLPVGLGVAEQDEFWLFEDDPGRKVRAAMMDEGLAMLRRLWQGEPFDFSGTYYRSRSVDHPLEPPPPPPPVQGSPDRPRIPIWVVGAWPRMKSMRRPPTVVGLLPAYLPRPGEYGELTPEVLAEAVAWLAEERAAAGLSMADYDVVVEGVTPADRPEAGVATVQAWAEAGATWWLEADWSSLDPARVRAESERRLRAGPPRVEG